MARNVPQTVMNCLSRFARRCDIDKIILFGSRARGTYSEKSDFDIAVSGGDVGRFYDLVEDEMWSLLSFDIIDLNGKITDELNTEIERDGIVIYEKA